MTVNQMRDQLDMYMNEHKGQKTIITLDHTILVKRAPYQNNRLDMLFELGEFFTQTKRDYPCLFIALSQLNRNIDNPDRAIDGKYGNYILESDIFGSDAMLQHADTRPHGCLQCGTRLGRCRTLPFPLQISLGSLCTLGWTR